MQVQALSQKYSSSESRWPELHILECPTTTVQTKIRGDFVGCAAANRTSRAAITRPKGLMPLGKRTPLIFNSLPPGESQFDPNHRGARVRSRSQRTQPGGPSATALLRTPPADDKEALGSLQMSSSLFRVFSEVLRGTHVLYKAFDLLRASCCPSRFSVRARGPHGELAACASPPVRILPRAHGLQTPEPRSGQGPTGPARCPPHRDESEELGPSHREMLRTH